MNADYPTDEVPATPEYVLEVLRDQHRMALAVREADRIAITPETPLWEWEESLLIDSWDEGFGEVMNKEWGVAITPAEWQVFQSVERTLGDLARLIASHAQRPKIRPWKHIGGNCLPAGAFLTVRAMLAQGGADPNAITPSTPLAPYLTHRHSNFWQFLTKLQPGVGPAPAYPRPVRALQTCAGFASSLSLIMCCVRVELSVVMGVIFFSIMLMLLLLDRTLFWHFPNSHIHTFRDLAYALAGQQPRRRIQPTP